MALGWDIKKTLVEQLAKAVEDNLNEVDDYDFDGMVRITHRRDGNACADEDGEVLSHTIIGASIEFPEEVAQVETVVSDFASALSETHPIVCVFKFEDPLLRERIANWAAEIFDIEMKLRRVLSLIYLDVHQDRDPLNLLVDERAKPTTKDSPKPDQMRAAAENQFFYLTFGQYINLNQRADINLNTLLGILQTITDFETFRAEITRTPVPNEDDAILIAGLKERMDAIEKMRNCVAHNRRPTKAVIENYENVRPLVEKLLDEYLLRFQV
ncbi:MAG: hypothetical protein P4L81_00140 [Candidatus Pacebacteria bacterium]|jgi:hypothetical protein|nr:hypothetical protein [Candidatus Paceibacterota bacterium]